MSAPKGVPQPNKWKYGPAKDLRDKNTAFLKMRCQARFRGEPWKITFHEIDKIWDDNSWARKGPKGWNLCMSRIDPKKSWSKNNVHILTRSKNQLRINQLKLFKNKTVTDIIFKGKKFKNYHDMTEYYGISYQTARNWNRFNKYNKKSIGNSKDKKNKNGK